MIPSGSVHSSVADRFQPRLGHESRIILLVVLSALPAVIVALGLLWTRGFPPKLEWSLSVLVIASWLGSAFAVRHSVMHPLQTLSSLIAALREGDYSVRARSTSGALGQVIHEFNALGRRLGDERQAAFEAGLLLDKVMAAIDVAVLAFDASGRLRLVNAAGERLLGLSAANLIGQDADALHLADLLEGDVPRMVNKELRGGSGPWALRRSRFRQQGRLHELVVLSDVQRIFREEERQTWQRLVRVLGHEINNSLAPIQGLADALRRQLEHGERTPDLEEDLRSGLGIIQRRAEALGRFLTAYTRLAKLPPPRLQPLRVDVLIQRVSGLTQRQVEVKPGPEITLSGDSDQLEQVLLNLLHNAVDAVAENGGGVSVTWSLQGTHLEILVLDEGPGIANPSNLFVPFFTTKPEGNGIGLVLSRQIVEAHGGTLTLRNRTDQGGCEARLRLPLL